MPTVAESGYPDFNVVASYAVLAQAGTPAAIVSRLNTELAKIANQPEMRERMAALGIEPLGSTPEQLAATMQFELDRWTKLAQSLGLKHE